MDIYKIPRPQRRRDYPAPTSAHGTAEGYYKHACLCQRCRSFARDYRGSLEHARLNLGLHA